MKIIEGLYYAKEHEWVRVEGEKAYIGITDYAQKSLGDIVFVEMPEVDSEIAKDDDFAVVESIKAASDIYSPVSGKVLEINEKLSDEPEALNEDPYQNFIVCLFMEDESELDGLMNAQEYEAFCSKE